MWLFWIALILVSFYLGAYFGIKDCKNTFGIPKGLKSSDEFADYVRLKYCSGCLDFLEVESVPDFAEVDE